VHVIVYVYSSPAPMFGLVSPQHSELSHALTRWRPGETSKDLDDGEQPMVPTWLPSMLNRMVPDVHAHVRVVVSKVIREPPPGVVGGRGAGVGVGVGVVTGIGGSRSWRLTFCVSVTPRSTLEY